MKSGRANDRRCRFQSPSLPILIEHTHVLPALYGHVLIPPAVSGELNRQRTPLLVRAWLARRRSWLEIRAPQRSLAELTAHLGTGEREAIALAEELVADAVLLDDWTARLEAQRRHLTVLGTLRVLADAAEKGFADLRAALDRLQQTNFRARPELIEALLKWDAQRKHK